MRLLLAGEDPVLNLLRKQSKGIISVLREYTGAGVYMTFTLADDVPRLSGQPSFVFGDVVADIEGLQLGAGFLLFVRNGLLHMLELYAYEDSFPTSIGQFSVRYENGEVRNIAELRGTPNWPK